MQAGSWFAFSVNPLIYYRGRSGFEGAPPIMEWPCRPFAQSLSPPEGSNTELEDDLFVAFSLLYVLVLMVVLSGAAVCKSQAPQMNVRALSRHPGPSAQE